jgi:ribosomal-protein-alanine N-acetyltransferase
MTAGVTTRLVAPDDAAELAALLNANRDFLAPWEPFRTDDYYTAEGQRSHLESVLRQWEAGAALPHVIVEDGWIVGRITLSGITRGATCASTASGSTTCCSSCSQRLPKRAIRPAAPDGRGIRNGERGGRNSRAVFPVAVLSSGP